MARIRVWIVAALAVAIAAVPVVQAELFTKKYIFKSDIILEMHADMGGTARLDTVRFLLPEKPKSGMIRLGGLAKAEVAISNTGTESIKIGIAIAALDDNDRLLGVASGGSRFMAIKAGRQSTYTLVFDDVNLDMDQATSFQISVETRP
jgi:hypothetical protein